MSRPAVSDIVLYQDLLGGSRVSGDLGGGRFNVISKKGEFALAAPDFATEAIMDESHQLRSLAFPMEQWQKILDEAAGGGELVEREGPVGGRAGWPAGPALRRDVRAAGRLAGGIR
jgi:hypothetical protein